MSLGKITEHGAIGSGHFKKAQYGIDGFLFFWGTVSPDGRKHLRITFGVGLGAAGMKFLHLIRRAAFKESRRFLKFDQFDDHGHFLLLIFVHIGNHSFQYSEFPAFDEGVQQWPFLCFICIVHESVKPVFFISVCVRMLIMTDSFYLHMINRVQLGEDQDETFDSGWRQRLYDR